ncbi:MAG: hypothetical protein FJ087_18870 [Deltaproteobacteria bacterium]|nr:hypothetical protein [Deltaproteobacteria bacterium]
MRLMEFLRAHLTPGQRRFVKFLVVGASGVPVNLGVVFLVTQVVPAASLAAGCGTSWRTRSGSRR